MNVHVQVFMCLANPSRKETMQLVCQFLKVMKTLGEASTNPEELSVSLSDR